MEIKFNNVCYKNKFTNVTFEIKSGKINGIYNYNTFLKLIINPKLINAGSIYIDDKQYKNFDYINIAIIDKEKEFYTSKVIDEILFYAKLRNYKSKNIKKEILELLKELNLDEDILKRIGHSLSETEKYFIKIIANLITKPQIVIFKDIMNGIDYHNKKILKRLINQLKDDGALVILTSMDSNILYELTDEVFIFDKGKLLTSGLTNNIYTNIEVLIKNKIDVPYFSLLTYKANNEKNVNLFYRKDVRDVIKDVYKSVS